VSFLHFQKLLSIINEKNNVYKRDLLNIIAFLKAYLILKINTSNIEKEE